MNIRILAASAVLITCQSAFAGIAYDNFGPGDSYNPDIGWAATGTGTGVPFQSACQFTSLESGSLKSITIAWTFVGDHNTGVLSLFNDNSDTVGSLITAWSFSGLGGPYPGQYAPVTLPNGFPGITLTAGQKYWVEVSPGDDMAIGVWNINSTGALGWRGVSSNGGATYSYFDDQDTGAMRVETVPEPASMAVLGLGALALRRRRA